MDENSESLTVDMNGDGQVTISDVWDGLVHILLAPGDLALELIINASPQLAEFLELTPADYGSPLSKFLSAVLWMIAFIVVGIVYSSISRFDHWLTRHIARLWGEVVRQARIARIRAISAINAHRVRARAAASEVTVERLLLDEFEAAVLRCHAGADDFAVLTARETAARLTEPRRRVQSTLEKLTRLRLLERGFGTDEGEPGYRLTRAGEIYLIEC